MGNVLRFLKRVKFGENVGTADCGWDMGVGNFLRRKRVHNFLWPIVDVGWVIWEKEEK